MAEIFLTKKTPYGIHLVRRVAYPLDFQHGRYVLRKVLDVDAAQVVRTAGARRIRSYRRGETKSPDDGAPKSQSASGATGDSSPPDVRRMLFLDTETTGLGGPGTYVFLVGLGYLEDDAFVVEQHFIRNPDEEAAMLQVIAETLPQWPVMITFNGVSFDLPLLRARMKSPRPPGRPTEYSALRFDLRRAAPLATAASQLPPPDARKIHSRPEAAGRRTL